MVVRQNPAYRPIACSWNGLLRIFVGGCSFSMNQRGRVNRSFSNWFLVFPAALTLGCGASRSAPGAPGESRVIPTSTVGPWSFSHSPGTRAYEISRTASVQGIADSEVRQEKVSNFTHEVLTFEPLGERLVVRALVDAFTLKTEGVVGPAQPVELPIQLSATITPSGVRIEPSANNSCNAAEATVATDLHNLLAPYPARFSKGAVWRDTIIVSGCQAGIPITTTTRRTFRVSGEVMYSGQPLILVQRTDSLSARGEGAYNQHRMMVEGRGVGTALYYLDTVAGEISWLSTSQGSQIRVTTSGRLHAFTQTTNQEFVRVR
jgi:hypothetical protein